jgi:hypothetical protein
MDTKPFSLQAPESIAKEYGGNKQKIAQAASMGLVDPTAAVLAGMFIDRMRSAQMTEQGPPQTVAQQVFQPPVQPMPAPPMGGAPGMAPPPPQMPGAPGMAPPPPQMPGAPGMAEGGLAALPVPDDMFEETDDYASGGIVAFAEAGAVNAPPAAPRTFYGLSVDDPAALAAFYDRFQTPTSDQYTREMEQEYIRERAPEARKQRRSQDMWEALAQMGFNMAASKSPSFLQAIGEAGSATLPRMQESARERKAEDRELRRGLIDIERGRRTEAAARTQGLVALHGQATGLAEAAAARDLQVKLQEDRLKAEAEMLERRIAADQEAARISAAGRGGGGGGGGGRDPNLSDFEGRVLVRYNYLKSLNRNLPTLPDNMRGRPFARDRYRRTDDALRNQAMEEVSDMVRGNGGGGAAETRPTVSRLTGGGGGGNSDGFEVLGQV